MHELVCVYCMRPFQARRKRRCCRQSCERRVRGKAAYVTRSRRQAVDAIMAQLQKRLRFVPDFRRAAMGEQLDFDRVFGVAPHPGPLRHGETIDA